MRRSIFIVFTLLHGFIVPSVMAQSLEECQQAAEKNYPLIRQYGLIEKTTVLTVDNIQKGWLPQVSASAQATYQSDVPSWPDQMETMMNSMGIHMKGLKKDQYRVGIDVSQTIYDGGAISSRKTIAREQGNVEAAQTEVSIYNVRKRVNEMYFALLLLDEQIKLNSDLQALLSGFDGERRYGGRERLAEREGRTTECGAAGYWSCITETDAATDAEHFLWHGGERSAETAYVCYHDAGAKRGSS